MKANIGCGQDYWGDIRIDKNPTIASNLQYDLEAGIPLDSESVDEIRLWAMLEHTPNPGKLLSECHRVLKKGGKIDLLTDYAGFIGQYLFHNMEHNKRLKNYYLNHNELFENDGHYALYIPSHLKLLMKDFKIEKTYYQYSRRGKMIQLILKCLPFKMGAVNIGVVAVKR